MVIGHELVGHNCRGVWSLQLFKGQGLLLNQLTMSCLESLNQLNLKLYLFFSFFLLYCLFSWLCFQCILCILCSMFSVFIFTRQGLVIKSTCLSVCLSVSHLHVLDNFEPCDWLTRISLVILARLSLARIRVLSDHQQICPE